MSSPRSRSSRSRIRRVVIVGLALFGYLAGAIGVPVPANTPASTSAPTDDGQSIRSARHSCGCGPAARCMKRCCCSIAEQQPAAAAGSSSPSPEPNRGESWIIAMSARECHGQDTFWFSTASALPPPACVSWSYLWTVEDWLPLSNSERFTRSMPPPTPPPRS